MKKIVILCGPTAVGKTAAALEIAREIPLEVINADSGQIYREMEIGTAKPSSEERKSVPFHLLDIRDPSEPFSAADFRRLAGEAIEEVTEHGRLPLVVGGTGLYIKVLTGGIFEGPERDTVLRAKLGEEFNKTGPQPLHDRLKKIDPVAADAIPPTNRHRLIRALEVFELTGRPISSYWKEHRFKDRLYDVLKIGLSLPPEVHEKRIAERVDRMFSAGLIEEVERLVRRWGAEAPGLRSIGYREVVSCLRGDLSREESVALVKQHTRQYAKRQRTWFRRDPEIRWFLTRHDCLLNIAQFFDDLAWKRRFPKVNS